MEIYKFLIKEAIDKISAFLDMCDAEDFLCIQGICLVFLMLICGIVCSI